MSLRETKSIELPSDYDCTTIDHTNLTGHMASVDVAASMTGHFRSDEL